MNNYYQDILVNTYSNVSDEELITLARHNDELASEYLILKYKNLVRAKARPYFLLGADREDIIQEGMIGLYKAIRDYDEDKLSSFKNFADICITRQIITAVKAATRYKHTPLNTYVSLNLPIFEQNDSRTVEDMISSNVPTASNPEDIFIIKENYTRIENKLYKLLSDFEYKVFEKYISGKSYQEIANELGKTMKSVDNALQRIKKKIERCLDKND